MKKKITAGLALMLVLVLAGCSNLKLTTTKTTYKPSGMTAVVKGTASSGADLTYQIGKKTSKVKNNHGDYVFTVPASNVQQTVKVKAKSAGKTVTKKVQIKKVKPLGSYAMLTMKYSAILQQMHLTAKALPETVKPGIHDLIKTDSYTIRGNIQNDQLIGATFIIPTKALKQKSAQQEFGTAFSVFSSTVGADGEKVFKEFNKQTKNQSKGQTTVKEISSNGVHYNIGFSTTTLYMYITK
ncbi:hypothetical protein [Loigolactobacillus backii]|uniref:Uncharacterized protein n=1 Tax=Loigolactobacillus backii TaxID=375175 RepID=A0A192H4V9_9LACO|nr:hypothetical protein [Loigolactobacillus backii]ANK59410.1 hypothetical protein AYR52_03610 [Loigolactobacillus backii]ANK63011.1 hypothetical protein AYR53_09705 [Loigolactobacillus backii]ANK64404.1 hypothetical protein AYR54_03620 [Loigolactobacillus backii]ANK67202.1 hypothetical protein AYR55_05420 [Loigolactobacillus backii]ANK69981.1 hypothetical protein AYR56_07300 [Loigolactobacillus backii]